MLVDICNDLIYFDIEITCEIWLSQYLLFSENLQKLFSAMQGFCALQSQSMGSSTFCPIDCIEETRQNYFIGVHSPLSPSSLPLTAANRVVTLFDILKKLSLWEGVTSINMDIDVLLLS